jgi:hypothetical protein
MRTLTLTLIFFALLLTAAAQTTTTYTLPAGTNCISINGCWYPVLAADGSQFGQLAIANVSQIDYDHGPQPVAQYCTPGTITLTQTATPQFGPTSYHFVFQCAATPEQTSQDAPMLLHAEIQAHSYVARYCFRSCIYQTRWIVDSGSTLEITQ